MPYKSRAQSRYFHYLESKGKLPKKTAHEFDESTDFEHLPEHVEHHAYGGEVGEDSDSDYDHEMGQEEEYNSSGEPHTNDEFEEEHPMQYMNKGGSAHKSTEDRRREVDSFRPRFKAAQENFDDPFYVPSNRDRSVLSGRSDAAEDLDKMDNDLYKRYPETAKDVLDSPPGGKNEEIIRKRSFAKGGMVHRSNFAKALRKAY